MKTTIVLPDEKKAIEWLGKAVGRDASRPELEGFRRTGNVFVATDGYRMHVIKTPRCMEELNEANEHGQVVYRRCNVAIAWEQQRGEYPPGIRDALPSGEPEFSFPVSPRFLIEALEGFVDEERGVVVTVYGENKIVVQGRDGGSGRSALLMGLVGGSEDLWVPDLASGEEEYAR